MTERERFSGRMDRMEVVRRARKAGLPEAVAERIAQVVTGAGLSDDRREEVFRELVAHFEDGLAAGRSAEALLEAFGDGRRTAALIAVEKRVVTPEAAGGTGPGDGVLRRLVRDVGYALRRLSARPAFTATAVASLALGIGANSSMFTLINDVILRRPPLERPEELVELYQRTTDFPHNVFSEPTVAEIRRGTAIFSGLAASKMSMVPFEADGRIGKYAVELVSGDYFETLGLHPIRGRLFGLADAPAPGQGAVVVLGERFWRSVLGADEGVVGRSIRLNGSSYQVVGILGRSYPGRLRALPTDIYLPAMMMDQLEGTTRQSQLLDEGTTGTFLAGRLKPGVSIQQAVVELDRLAADFKARRAQQWQGDASFLVFPKAEVLIHPPIDKYLVPVAGMLMLVVGLVLVIACANLAGFLLARAVDRRKEIAVRLALGATRGQLVAQLLVETVLLAIGGGVVGVLLGRMALRAVLSSDIPLPVPIDLALTLDWRVVTFSLLVSVVAGLFFGLMPALQSTRLELASVIRDETTGGGRSKGVLRQLLVGGQVAVSMVLLVVAGLFVRSLDVARRVDPGFGARPAGLIWLGRPGEGEVRPIRDRTIQRFAAIPGVEQVGLTTNIHLNTLGTQSTEIVVPGVEPPPGRTSHLIERAAIDTGFVAAVGLRLLRGRNFGSADRDTVGPDGVRRRPVLVNEAFVAQFYPGRDALGQRFRAGETEIEIVGVTNTVKTRSLAEEPRPFLYEPLSPDEAMTWVVARTSGDSERIAAEMRRVLPEVDPRLFAFASGTLERHIATMSYPLKMGATALMAFALVALIMACIGLYGAVSYAVAQRSREVGIRLSLGAARGSVVRLLLVGGLRLVAGGVLVGLGLAIIVGKLLEGLLFGVRGIDPVTLVVVPLVLILVTLLAAWVPARRAGRIDPVVALKSE